MAAMARLPTAAGIDLETPEERSEAFVLERLSDEEGATLPGAGQVRDAVMCSWTGN